MNWPKEWLIGHTPGALKKLGIGLPGRHGAMRALASLELCVIPERKNEIMRIRSSADPERPPGLVVRQARFSFTLIELLLVIGLIGLLAGLLFPMLTRARGCARSLGCRSNLRQLGLGATLYSSDAGRLPVMLSWLYAYSTAKDWEAKDLTSGQLYPYVGSRRSYLCPSEKPRLSSGSSKTPGVAHDHNYVINCMICHTHDLSACLTPAKSLFFIERTNLTNDTIGGLMPDPGNLDLYHIVAQIPFYHDQRASLLMMDLHVEGLTRPRYDTDSATREFWYPSGDSSFKGAP